MSYKVSIIVPVYNVEKYIDACIQSLLSQTLKDIEIIFVDDCSTDNSKNIIKKYLKDNPSITLIEQETNQGEVVAKYTGAQVAKADIIGTLDPDDYFADNAFQKMYDAVIKNNVDIAICNMQFVDQENNKLENQGINVAINNVGQNSIGPSNIYKINPATTNKIMRKEIYLRSLNFKERDVWKDFYQYWRGFGVNPKTNAVFIDEYLYFYRIRHDSITHAPYPKDKQWRELLKTMNLILEFLQEHNSYNEYKKAFWLDVKNKIDWAFNGKIRIKKLFDLIKLCLRTNISIFDLKILLRKVG